MSQLAAGVNVVTTEHKNTPAVNELADQVDHAARTERVRTVTHCEPGGAGALSIDGEMLARGVQPQRRPTSRQSPCSEALSMW